MSSSNLTQHPVSSADPPFGCSNIADAAIACRNSLTSCNTISYLWDEWAENRLADFRLWDASIGASSQSGSSLEDRLISTPHIKKVILSLLNVFKVTIDECREFGES
ncbi:hypothetical protein BU25DRAFT_406381 [Macroventuria anomochaeta]|uniref:Uncharacterized protein n=1 Tax=Macroventuria anomochaeta TaxID=301207 RepID=A0ACB6SII8_9PLEO|nr:uncharacterized protein BU25DRAFT_406381 [Macroventuria anomochaeta]KAF2633129.1 hypothetical protein BU25DRAFT_406381 [Macroventuria anomochaeta]